MAVGKTRAKQRWCEDGSYRIDPNADNTHKVLCLQVHGDASFSGQVLRYAVLGVYTIHYTIGFCSML